MDITFEISGDTQIRRKLLRYADNASDMRPVFRALHKNFVTMEKEQFESQGKTGSGGWRAISPAWVEQKRQMRRRGTMINGRRVVDIRILHMTRRLRNSFTQAGHPDRIRTIDRNGFFFGTRVPYAGFHQNPQNKDRQRRPIEFTDAQRKGWINAIQRFLRTGEATAGDVKTREDAARKKRSGGKG